MISDDQKIISWLDEPEDSYYRYHLEAIEKIPTSNEYDHYYNDREFKSWLEETGYDTNYQNLQKDVENIENVFQTSPDFRVYYNNPDFISWLLLHKNKKYYQDYIYFQKAIPNSDKPIEMGKFYDNFLFGKLKEYRKEKFEKYRKEKLKEYFKEKLKKYLEKKEGNDLVVNVRNDLVVNVKNVLVISFFYLFVL